MIESSVRTWNYRVIEFVDPDGNPWRAIHEVQYEGGVPVSYSEGAAVVMWDTAEQEEAAHRTINGMISALAMPGLTEHDFAPRELRRVKSKGA